MNFDDYLDNLPDDSECLASTLHRWDPAYKLCYIPIYDGTFLVKPKTSSFVSVFVFHNNVITWIRFWSRIEEIRKNFKDEYDHWVGLLKTKEADFEEVAFETNRACDYMNSRIRALKLEDFKYK